MKLFRLLEISLLGININNSTHLFLLSIFSSHTSHLQSTINILNMDSTYGLGWKNDVPIWTVRPSDERIADVAHRHLHLSADEIARTTTKLEFQGSYNRLYAVECPRGSFLMRLALPVDPHFKTLSEVATIAVVRSRTTVPVPHIIASNSNNNELKFEWILMERVPGVPLVRAWDSLPWDAMVSCVKEVAGIMAQLFEVRYDSIGNLYHAKDLPVASHASKQRGNPKNAVVVDRIVSSAFFWKTHLKSNVHRGPFASSEDWLDAKVQLMEEDLTRISKSEDADQDEIEKAEKARRLLDRLRKNISYFFNFYDREEFALHHSDIHQHNLILDPKTGKLQALVDWECVSVMPLWKVCQIPKFIHSKERKEKPLSEYYDTGTDGELLYAAHLYDYEDTRLREEFLAEMARLAPQWIEEHQKSKMKMDFERALWWSDDFTKTERVSAWLDHIEAGEEYRKL